MEYVIFILYIIFLIWCFFYEKTRPHKGSPVEYDEEAFCKRD